MATTGSGNPRIPLSLRAVSWVESAVAFAAGAIMFLTPSTGTRIWAWAPPPFNARFLGAIYFAALVPLLILAAQGRWAPGRVVLWMTFTFTFSIMVTMFFYRDQFEWSRPVAWAFWILLILLPILSAVFLTRLRSWAPADPRALPPPWIGVLQILAVLLGSYALALLAIPKVAASFWPWPVDDFHGRIYAAIFAAPAVGAWLVRAFGNRREYITLGLTLATLGLFTVAGMVWTNAIVPPERQVDYGAAGTIAFLVMNAVLIVIGGALARAGSRLRG